MNTLKNPTSYREKRVLLGYTLFFLLWLKNIDCGYSLEPPHQGGFNEHPQSMFQVKIRQLSWILN